MTTLVHDEHGNVIPIDPTSQVGQAIQLLEYCRARDFQIGPYLKIDGLVMQVADLRQVLKHGPRPAPDIGPWTAAGFPEGDGGGG